MSEIIAGDTRREPLGHGLTSCPGGSYCLEECSGACEEPRLHPALAAPFPWFGGKRRVASEVWAALGDVEHYVEPFAGSLAVLLERPHAPRLETINDLDGHVANFWRAVQREPDAVAYHADWPVNETDLEARHLWLVTTGADRLEQLRHDPDAYDAKVAGWWVWGLCAWIGSGWCSGNGPWGDAGRGINRQRPHLSTAGQGINRQLQHLGTAGQGINRNVQAIHEYMAALSRRLRAVRVCHGDWSRIVTDGALALEYGRAEVGIFLDPPYAGDVRTRALYRVDDDDIAARVRAWAIEHGNDPRYRIVLAGYEAEHVAHMPSTWTVHAYRSTRAYGTAAGAGLEKGNNARRRAERLWFSPGCRRASQERLL